MSRCTDTVAILAIGSANGAERLVDPSTILMVANVEIRE
jgi:hypothetical protein